jgi:hypothetical protein
MFSSVDSVWDCCVSNSPSTLSADGEGAPTGASIDRLYGAVEKLDAAGGVQTGASFRTPWFLTNPRVTLLSDKVGVFPLAPTNTAILKRRCSHGNGNASKVRRV